MKILNISPDESGISQIIMAVADGQRIEAELGVMRLTVATSQHNQECVSLLDYNGEVN